MTDIPWQSWTFMGADIVLGGTGTTICPLLYYLSARGDQSGPSVVTPAKKPATQPWFTQQIREILAALGLSQDDFEGHNFLIGATITAALQVVEVS